MWPARARYRRRGRHGPDPIGAEERGQENEHCDAELGVLGHGLPGRIVLEQLSTEPSVRQGPFEEGSAGEGEEEGGRHGPRYRRPPRNPDPDDREDHEQSAETKEQDALDRMGVDRVAIEDGLDGLKRSPASLMLTAEAPP